MSSDRSEKNYSAKTPLSWEDIARLRWLSKPRLHTEIFEEYRKATHIASFDDGGSPPDETELLRRRRAEMLAEIERIKSIVGGDERFEQLSELVLAFRESPSIERYSLIRKRFPEIDIKVASGGVSAVLAIENQCEEYGIPVSLLGGALDGSEPDIDELCLILIDHLVARDKIEGPGAMQRRRAAISDAMVNYLIAFMLEGAHWADEEIRVPPSLVLLIRHRLGALKGDLHAQYESGEMKLAAAWFAGQRLGPQERLSINRLLELSRQIPGCSVSRSTAARWLKDAEFRRRLKWSRDSKARLSSTKSSLTKNNVRDIP